MRISIAGLVLFFVFLVAGCGGGGSSGGGGGNDGGGGGGDGTPDPDRAPEPSPTASASGVLNVPDGQRLDGTTKDPNDPVIDNDTVGGGGQPVFPPVTIGGYTNSETDEWDIYRVDLQGPTRFVLTIADHEDSDLDLYLAEIDGTIIDGSLGTGRLEILESESGRVGEFLIAVHAFEGEGNYLLSVGGDPVGTNVLQSFQDGLRLSLDFVPEELVLMAGAAEPFAEQNVVRPSSIVEGFEVSLGMTPKIVAPSGMTLMSTITEDTWIQSQRLLPDLAFPLRYRSDDQETKARTLALIKTLRRDPNVKYAYPNYLAYANGEPNDEFFNFQWHYRQINLPQAWDVTRGSDEIVVAVIDTGVAYTHPDLESRVLRREDGSVVGYDFIRLRPDGFDPGDSTFGVGSSFHGTHVAGTIAAATNNETGVAGVTWSGKFMPLRVLGPGGGTEFDVTQAILYAAGLPNVSGAIPPARAEIMNLSLGPRNQLCSPFPPVSSPLRQALEGAINAGSVVVIAAGNDNCGVPSPMSTVEGVINVSAVDRSGRKAPYSNFGHTVDVSAPGGDMTADLDGDGIPDGVLSTWVDDTGGGSQFRYRVLQGTSMAAPHVAGVIALMRSVNPSLTPNDINRLLAGTHPDPAAGPITRDLGEPGRDDLFGHGLIDAFQAVNVGLNVAGGVDGAPSTDTPVLTVSPESLNFGSALTSLQLTISNPSTGQLTVSEITPNVSWISVDVTDFPALAVNVDRSDLPEGDGIGAVLIRSNAGDRTVRVFVGTQAPTTGGDVGTVYVLVVDADSLEAVDEAVTSEREGYRYETSAFPAGKYLIVAGTDRNDDGYICDAGEACGIYPLFDSPVLLEMEGEMRDLDFAVSYDFSFGVDQGSNATANQGLMRFKRLEARGE